MNIQTNTSTSIFAPEVTAQKREQIKQKIFLFSLQIGFSKEAKNLLEREIMQIEHEYPKENNHDLLKNFFYELKELLEKTYQKKIDETPSFLQYESKKDSLILKQIEEVNTILKQVDDILNQLDNTVANNMISSEDLSEIQNVINETNNLIIAKIAEIDSDEQLLLQLNDALTKNNNAKTKVNLLLKKKLVKSQLEKIKTYSPQNAEKALQDLISNQEYTNVFTTNFLLYKEFMELFLEKLNIDPQNFDYNNDHKSLCQMNSTNKVEEQSTQQLDAIKKSILNLSAKLDTISNSPLYEIKTDINKAIEVILNHEDSNECCTYHIYNSDTDGYKYDSKGFLVMQEFLSNPNINADSLKIIDRSHDGRDPDEACDGTNGTGYTVLYNNIEIFSLFKVDCSNPSPSEYGTGQGAYYKMTGFFDTCNNELKLNM